MGAEWSLKEKNEHKMEVGSIVTLKLAENNSASNTYVISKIIDDSCLLFHPLLPDVFILRNKSDLDLVMATPKDSTLKILEFVSDYRRHLSPEDLADFEALCMYFIVHRKLANRQKHVLSSLGGKIASEYCMDDISIAIAPSNPTRPSSTTSTLCGILTLKKSSWERSQSPLNVSAYLYSI